MTSVALGGTLGLTVVGALPTTAGDAGIRAGYATGVSNVGAKLPVLGKIKGTTMVLKSTGKLKKSLKKFKFKGGIKL